MNITKHFLGVNQMNNGKSRHDNHINRLLTNACLFNYCLIYMYQVCVKVWKDFWLSELPQNKIKGSVTICST